MIETFVVEYSDLCEQTTSTYNLRQHLYMPTRISSDEDTSVLSFHYFRRKKTEKNEINFQLSLGCNFKCTNIMSLKKRKGSNYFHNRRATMKTILKIPIKF